jgi:hypothetical protein
MLDMPQQCAICRQDFRMEPGFYSGALWTSYPLGVLIIILSWLIFHQLLSLSFSLTFLCISLIALLLQPVIMRFGRAIWINLFVDYRDM